MEPPQRTFDVICAGEALWNVSLPTFPAGSSDALRPRPGGGAVNAALVLARLGLAVGLATVLVDDSAGRALRERIETAGVDCDGVIFGPPRQELVIVDATGDAQPILSSQADDPIVTVPERWSSQVLLLSGLTPIVAHGAALCKAARRARRMGTIVVVDVNARWRLWAGHEPRAIAMVLREADVVRCSAKDLAALGVDEATLRSSLRKDSVLVVSNGARDAWATGPFGQVVRAPEVPRMELRAAGAGDAFTAAICAELSRRGRVDEARPELWDRALRRGHAVAS